MYHFQRAYPTPQHESAANHIVDFFSQQPSVEAILLTCSCARGKASRDSCLDIAVLAPPEVMNKLRPALEQRWDERYRTAPVYEDLRRVGKYSHVDLDLVDGQFAPGYHGWTSGPDEFELTVGNLLVYSVPLWEHGDYLARLKASWLPYYDNARRGERLAMVRRYCLNNLDHIPLFVERGLYFQAFHRLYNALGEFLQALFISRRVYPIAYDKWVKEQIVEILELPELYPRLPALLEIHHFESREIADKGEELTALLDRYVIE